MSFKQVIELADLLDDGRVTGEDVVKYVTAEGNVKATCTTVTGAKGSTDFVKFLIPGKNGKTKGGTAPTLGIVGRLGGLGARPERIGFTSDGDGALAASAIAAKLARMTVRGDELEGDSWVDISYEQLIAMNPDVIIIPTNNMANGQPDFTAADVIADEQLKDITAVKNGAVYNMPTGFEAWDSPVPSGVLGMLWITAKLHPEVYTMDEFAADATDFYKTFYGFDMDTSSIFAETAEKAA